MVIYVKNPKLKNRVFKSIRYWENLALKYYKIGQMSKGRKCEAKSDRLYKQNYHKMFAVKRS